MSEVPLYMCRSGIALFLIRPREGEAIGPFSRVRLQGYPVHKKTPCPRALR
jgi:hypothetical protein